jgi:hypothetical protein
MRTKRFVQDLAMLGLATLLAACGGKKDEAPMVTLPPPLDLTVRASIEDELHVNFNGADGKAKQPIVSLKTGKIIGGDMFGPNDRFFNMFVNLKGHPRCRFFVGVVSDEETFAKAVSELEGQKPEDSPLATFKSWVKKEEQPGGWLLDYMKGTGDRLTEHSFNLVKTIGGKRYTCNTYTDADADGQKCIDAVAQACATLDAKK